MEKTWNIMIMTEDAEVLWLDNENQFVEDRLNSKVLGDDDSKAAADSLRSSGEYVMVGRFPTDLDWKARDGRVIYCPTKNKLESMLKTHLEGENYEAACLVRDQLKRIEEK
jgi:protein-arginine kinase activator protein McsA